MLQDFVLRHLFESIEFGITRSAFVHWTDVIIVSVGCRLCPARMSSIVSKDAIPGRPRVSHVSRHLVVIFVIAITSKRKKIKTKQIADSSTRAPFRVILRVTRSTRISTTGSHYRFTVHADSRLRAPTFSPSPIVSALFPPFSIEESLYFPVSYRCSVSMCCNIRDIDFRDCITIKSKRNCSENYFGEDIHINFHSHSPLYEQNICEFVV